MCVSPRLYESDFSRENSFESVKNKTQSTDTGLWGYQPNRTTPETPESPDDSDSNADSDSPLDGIVGEFDADGDGDISISELGQAGQAFASGELTITDLGQVGVGAAFAS
jgi:hypothetical protein